jgi:hypothetical protein
LKNNHNIDAPIAVPPTLSGVMSFRSISHPLFLQ